MADSKGTTTNTTSMKVDTKLVRQLADMLAETGLTEIEVEDGDRKIRVARQAPAAGGYAVAPAPAPAAVAPAPAAAAPVAEAAAAVPANALRSPMVGTAYL